MIRFENVTKVYPRSTRPAVDGVTVSIERGEFVFVVGPSGSGKSTILRLALREEAPSEGTVLVAGHEEDVEQPDDPGLAEPGELGEHLTGERRGVEADDEHLHRGRHRGTRARSSSYSSAPASARGSLE